MRPRSQCVGGMLLVQRCYKLVLNCLKASVLETRGPAFPCGLTDVAADRPAELVAQAAGELRCKLDDRARDAHDLPAS